MTTKEKIQDLINLILLNKGLENIEILPTTDLRMDLLLDSFDLAELTVRIEDEFNVDIFEGGIVTKVSEIIEIIDSRK